MLIKAYAEHRGVSPVMIYRYLKEGLISPNCITGKKPLQIDMELADACLAGSLSMDADVDESTLLFQKIRLTRINADRKELELQRASGLLIETAFAQRVWAEVLRRFISKIEIIPAKLPPMVIGLELPEIKAVTERLIYECREELSSPDLVEAALLAVCEQMQQAPAPAKKVKRK